MSDPAPYVPPGRTLPEVTLRSVALGIVLSAVLSAANAYLGLFAGLTVSASIPAAVLSMALLRALGGNILENNGVQTAASAGEAVAAGAIFTLPALVLLGTWSGFAYWETALIAGFGGILGVLFTIPLRRALIVNTPLEFPEGVATAEVLKAGASGGGLRSIAVAGLLGAAFKLGETGLRLYQGTVEGARAAFGTVAYFGSSLSPALVAVGFIVGLNVAVLVFLGGAANWLVVIPLMLAQRGVPDGVAPLDAANALWSEETRFIGVGAMVVGGLWALVSLRGPLAEALRLGLSVYRGRADDDPTTADLPRTDRDLPMTWVTGGLVFSVVPLFFIFWRVTDVAWVSAVMAVVMLVAGFLFSAVAGYMAGLVGSSNNPISGVTIATILTSSLLLLGLLGRGSAVGPAAAILIGAVVCCAAAIAGDNMQDLKAGRLLGATPMRQQVLQMVGVLAAAAVMAPVLDLLQTAYGIGEATAEHPNALAAPQATLMASVAQGVFDGNLPWPMVGLGMGLAVGVIALDRALEARGATFRTPVLAVAVGIYLPLSLSVPILLGGLVAAAVARARAGTPSESASGLLFGAGLITGEALVGILLAVPIVITADPQVLALTDDGGAAWPGILFLGGITAMLYRAAVRKPH